MSDFSCITVLPADGKVSWFEFLEFMLVAMKKVDPDLLDELRAYFDRLDVSNTGELSRDTLIELARRKRTSPRRKLELYAYKQHLLNASRQTKTVEENPHEHGKWFEKSLGFLGFSTGHVPTNQDSQPSNIFERSAQRNDS